MKTLPVGRSRLEFLRKNNSIYVDKTEYIHRLLAGGSQIYFLSRPRRFGKSLLIDTLAELCKGNKALFEGTWIGVEERYDWTPRPVIQFDFSGLDFANGNELRAALIDMLQSIAAVHGVLLQGSSFVMQLRSLIMQLGALQKVVVLVDEYDGPIISTVLKNDLCSASREVLSNFYTTLKALESFIDFVFLTGVSKFSKTSVFSGMNNIVDISMEPEYAALCGYTQEELEACFADYLPVAASVLQVNSAQLLDDMRFWYNGYRFSALPLRVYNPFSVILFLQKKKFSNYWFETGTPTFLIEVIKKRFGEFQGVEGALFSEAIFSASDPEHISLAALLYQTGYVTIREYFSETRSYVLAYPNEEVRQSFSQALLGAFLVKDSSKSSSSLAEMKQALLTGDSAAFCVGLQSIIGSIPYNLHIERESYYHTILHTIGLAIGGVISEAATSLGRADLVLQSEKHLFVIELKIDSSAERALTQIKDRRYYEQFVGQGKIVYLIGLNFQFDSKLLTHAAEVILTPG